MVPLDLLEHHQLLLLGMQWCSLGISLGTKEQILSAASSEGRFYS